MMVTESVSAIKGILIDISYYTIVEPLKESQQVVGIGAQRNDK